MNIGMVLAGGSGTRMGGPLPKQFLEVAGNPLIIYTLEAFEKNKNIDHVIVVCKTDYKEILSKWILKYNLNKVKWIVDNGETRQESVENGIKSLQELCNEEDIVLIHDGARPLISQKIIDENIKGAKKFKAINTVLPSTDTVIRSIDGICVDSVPTRSELYLCQTPQSFQYGIIKKAHESAKMNNLISATDDCQLVIKLGQKVHLIHGDKLNFKVTTQEDLVTLKAIINFKENK